MPDLFVLVAQSVDQTDIAAMFDDGDAFVTDIMAEPRYEPLWALHGFGTDAEYLDWVERYHGS